MSFKERLRSRSLINKGSNKKALIVGINYGGTSSELSGCIADAEKVEKLLFEYGYTDIMLMKDNVKNSDPTYPSIENIRKKIKELISRAGANDQIFFYYSGHGSYVRDKDGDELDGKDEVICPADFEQNGFITDDELVRTLANPLRSTNKFRAVFDSCHSGTVVDTRYNLIYQPKSKSLQLQKNDNYGLISCESLILSGCLDTQVSLEIKLPNGTPGGVLTHFFCQYYQQNSSVSEKLREKSAGNLLTYVSKQCINGKFAQKPVLSLGQKSQVYRCTFLE